MMSKYIFFVFLFLICHKCYEKIKSKAELVAIGEIRRAKLVTTDCKHIWNLYFIYNPLSKIENAYKY